MTGVTSQNLIFFMTRHNNNNNNKKNKNKNKNRNMTASVINYDQI